MTEKQIHEITADDLRRLYEELAGQQTLWGNNSSRPAEEGSLSVYTLHGYVRAWKRFFRWARGEGVIGQDPAEKIRRPKLPQAWPKAMSPEDLERLLEAARGESLRDYAVMCFLADTACRIGGLASLTLDTLDLRGHQATLREKGNKAQLAHFQDRTELALARYLERERPAQQERLLRLGILTRRKVFLGKRGALTTSGIYLIVKRLAGVAGVEGRYNPHSIRHGWVRQALKRGANLEEVRRILGHTSIVTTAQWYAIYLDEEIHERHAELSWLGPEKE